VSTNITPYSLLNYRSTPATAAAPVQVVTGGGVKATLKSIRSEAQQLKKTYATPAAPAPALTASPVGVYRTAGYWQLPNLQPLVDLARDLIAKLTAMMAPVTPPVAPPATPTPPGTRPNGDTKFVLSSFNVLSSSAGKGKGYASGTSRIHDVEKILKANNVSVVGFQEMDANQLTEFKKIAGDEYGTFAGSSGKKGYHDTTIAWRKKEWKLEDSGTITVPSYAGRASKVPYVRLRNKETGQEAYFVDAHNPANTKRYHHQERFRDAAARQEAALVKRLMEQTGLPVFMVGDMNSVSEAREIFTEGAPLKAANPKGKAGIDWIFGSKKGVEFSNFRRTREGLIGKTTDHPVVFSSVKIDD
jgi:hypothetical protein